MDGVLDGPREDPEFAQARKKLSTKLSGQWAALAVDRVGHHTVKKLFRGLTEWDDKAILTAELAQALNRLGGNSMGRSVIQACAVKEFLEGEEAWKTAVRKAHHREELVEDILAIGEKDTKAEKKKKRKRKKHGKESAHNDDDHDAASKKSRVGKGATNVESIMNVISSSTRTK
jgi:nucleotidyltransferase/DNA polymerase involved in DNA repair